MTREQIKLASLDRRRFLQFILGLAAAADSLQIDSEASAPGKGKFFFADLHSGRLGFPCGYSIPSGMPGSIMKLVSAAALIDARLLVPDQKFECRGYYRLNGETYKCLYPHGVVDMVHAIGLSCNIYFAQAARRLSACTILDYAARFGLNQAVSEFAGGKFPESPRSSAQKYVLGLSPDLEPAALQILRLSALIATEGKVPGLFSSGAAGTKKDPFEIALSGTCFQVLKQGMRMAARLGTGKKLDPQNKLKLAIKTGTTPHGQSFQSWITGFFPYDAPRYAFVLRAAAGTSQDEAVPQARSFLLTTDWP